MYLDKILYLFVIVQTLIKFYVKFISNYSQCHTTLHSLCRFLIKISYQTKFEKSVHQSQTWTIRTITSLLFVEFRWGPLKTFWTESYNIPWYSCSFDELYSKKSIKMQYIQEYLSNPFDPIDFQIRKSTFQINHFK